METLASNIYQEWMWMNIDKSNGLVGKFRLATTYQNITWLIQNCANIDGDESISITGFDGIEIWLYVIFSLYLFSLSMKKKDTMLLNW